MKKLFVVGLLVLGACSSPAKKGCTKIAELCNLTPQETAECAADFEELDKKSQTNASQKFAECTETATSCVAAAGCAAGAGASAFGTIADEFLKGFQKGLSK